MKPTKITRFNGTIEYRVDNLWHNDVGPAIEYANGDRSWYQRGKLHREDGPAITESNGGRKWFLNGVEYSEADFNAKLKDKVIKGVNEYGNIAYTLNGVLHREDGPALEYENGTKIWFLNGKHHREDGPSCEYYDGSKSWRKNGLDHREDGPAITYVDGRKPKWALDGFFMTEEEFNKIMAPKSDKVEKPIALCGDLTVKDGVVTFTDVDPTKPIQTTRPGGYIDWKLPNDSYHREDGPARISPTYKIWYKNNLRHRLDGPAYEGSDGGKSWWKDNKRHREDGPANIYPSGHKEWWLDGKQFTEEEFNKKMNIVDHTKPAMTTDINGNKTWKLNGKLHREDGPAVEYANGTKEWFKDGFNHREDGPAVEYIDGRKVWFIGGKRHRIGEPAFIGPEGKSWWKNGLRHREDGPAHIRTDGLVEWWIDGVKYSEEEFNKKMKTPEQVKTDPNKPIKAVHSNGNITWRLPNGNYHREDGPAIEYYFGAKSWYKEGKLHRDDNLPAHENADGIKYWYKNGKLHREDGPAEEHANGTKVWMINGARHRIGEPAYDGPAGKSWWKNGKRHREDGPAHIRTDGLIEWWIDGINYSEEEFNKKMKTRDVEYWVDHVNYPTKEAYDAHIKTLPIKVVEGDIIKYIVDGKYHRVDGPALITANGDKHWYKNGQLHRDDGPGYEGSNGTKSWYLNGDRHRVGGPAIESFNGDKYWYVNGQLHREDGPAIEYKNGNKSWYLNGNSFTEEEFNKKMSNTPIKSVVNSEERWHLDGKLHREDGPAWIESNGGKHWMFNGLHHRLDGPAFEGANGALSWWKNGKRHRLDGPARIDSKGNKEWYVEGVEHTEDSFKKLGIKNGKVMVNDTEAWYKNDVLHREDGPAIIRPNGFKEWVVNGNYHRLDGPAIEYPNGIKEWWINGVNVSEEKFLILTSNEKKEGIKVANETFMDRIKADATEAGYRVAATQFTAAVKGGILLLFKDKGFDDSKLAVVKEMLESEFGTAMVSAVLGYGLVYVPKLKEDPRVVKLAKEFRVNGMAVAGNEIMGIGMQYMMPALSKAMESLPPIKEVMPPVLRKKTGKKRVHTETPQIDQGETATEDKSVAV